MAISEEKRGALMLAIMEGKSMNQACKDLKIYRPAVYVDLAAEPDFANKYTRATEIRADKEFDGMFGISDGDGDPARDRLRIDTRKWALARMNPRKYGDKLAVGGADDLPPIQTEDQGVAKLAQFLSAIAERG